MIDENQRAKRDFIAAFFDDADGRVVFLSELADMGHTPEAMTLALVYIDRFAQCLRYPRRRTGQRGGPDVIELGNRGHAGADGSDRLGHALAAAFSGNLIACGIGPFALATTVRHQ